MACFVGKYLTFWAPGERIVNVVVLCYACKPI